VFWVISVNFNIRNTLPKSGPFLLCHPVYIVYVFLLLSIYSYCSSMYSYRCLCILIVVYVFLDAATLTEGFPCFFLGCKANARVKLAKTGHGPHSPTVVLFYVLIVLYRSMYCLCVNVYYCHRLTTQLQLTNHIYNKLICFDLSQS
jgi:hypothetical protein